VSAEPSRLRVALVDDEDLGRAILAELLGEDPGIEIVASCANGFEAIEAISRLNPDVVLLDVQMPGMTGIEVAELLSETPAIIFVTAYDQHAVRAFDLHAVDYLLKPVQGERLHLALQRARGRIGRGEGFDCSALAAARPVPAQLDRLLIREGGRVRIIPVGEIDHIEGRDDAVVVIAGGCEYRKAQRLADLEAALDPKRFIRIHRSFILNLDRLARIEMYARNSRVAVLTNGRRLPVSRAGYDRLRGRLSR